CGARKLERMLLTIEPLLLENERRNAIIEQSNPRVVGLCYNAEYLQRKNRSHHARRGRQDRSCPTPGLHRRLPPCAGGRPFGLFARDIPIREETQMEADDLLLAAFGCLVALAILIRLLIVYRRTGVAPIFVPGPDSAYGFILRVNAGIFALEGINIA